MLRVNPRSSGSGAVGVIVGMTNRTILIFPFIALLVLTACGPANEAADLAPGPYASRTSEAVLDLAPGPDMRAPVDLAPAPDPAKLVPTAACRSSRGFVLSDRAVACPGKLLERGDIERTCTNGYSICKSNPATPELCAALPGFYATRAVGRQQVQAPPQDDAGIFECRWTPSNSRSGYRVLRGCGSAIGTGPADPRTCGDNLATIAPCTSGSSWVCTLWQSGTEEDFLMIRNLDAGSGVLCCK